MILWTEIVLIACALLILTLYHVHLFYQVRTAPLTTSIGLANQLRRKWVKAIIEEKKDMLAVQTLRNWVMASSFLASAAILIGLSISSVVVRADKVMEISQALNLYGTKSEAIWLMKLMILVVDFFFAFINFALSIRYYNHASFAINVPPSYDPIVTHDAITRIIKHGTTHYTLGMRGYYLSVPFTLWLFGPIWLLAGAVVMTLILYKLDRTL